MALEFVDESDVVKMKDKEKKHELRLVDESNIKKVGGQDKKSYLDIVEESDVRKDPKIELIDRKVDGKSGLEFLAKEKIFFCERTKAGMTNNCTLCKELSRDRFNRCINKYGGP